MLRKALALLMGAALLALSAVGCVGARIPKSALQLSPESLENRQMQTRRFMTGDEASMLSSSAALLQDLGFQLTESETSLGVIVANKEREAISGGQIAGAVVLAVLFGAPTAVDKSQVIRASLVVHPVKAEAAGEYTMVTLAPAFEEDLFNLVARDASDSIPEAAAKTWCKKTAEELQDVMDEELRKKHLASGEMAVRITFQRFIYNTNNQVTRIEQINDAAVYQGFFDKLAQSVFLEAHEI